MDGKVQTSFIPKKPLIPSQGGNRSATAVNGFGILAIVIFVVSIAAAGGVFLWNQITQSQLNTNMALLEKAREQVTPEDIVKIRLFSQRMNIAKQLVASHIAASQVFDSLSHSTVKTIRFKSLSYATDEKSIRIGLTGESQSFSSIALQADAFTASGKFSSPEISDLQAADNGIVNFKFAATLPLSTVLYRNAILGDSSSTPPAATVTTPTTQ